MSRSERKLEHIRYALSNDGEQNNSFDEMEIVHQSLSNVNWDDLSLAVNIGELTLSSPLFVNAMTGGGGEKTEAINRNLAIVARETGISLAVGSQMSAIKDRTERKSYEIVRKENPSGIIFANLGSEATVDQAKLAIDMLEADAFQIHLNVMQELIMPEGDREFSNRLKNIETIVKAVDIPVIVKEVGFGISKEAAKSLKDIGVSIIDVGGKGGTNFSRVENKRRKTPLHSYNNWGIPTVAAIKEVVDVLPNGHVIASGGLRNGLDGVKSLVLGAKAFGMAGSLLQVLMNDGVEAVIEKINHIHEEVKVAMMILSANEPKELNGKAHVFFGKTKSWIEQRN